ncbi:MAG TPA: class C beta-lactamase-related serine hydrolase [candidate division Zixibacteria bacterium]|nr:class C beta-lactamase-related serine hydrolase [candidate division Zixibacteria bacterium]
MDLNFIFVGVYMFIKRNAKLLPSRTGNGIKARQIPITIIPALIILSVFLSCSGSNNSTGPDPSNGFEWTTAPPEEYGFDPDLLDTLTEHLTSGYLGRVTSVLIVRDKYLIYEEYFRGNDRNDAVSIYSCTKSISSALLGIAIGEGHIPGADAHLLDYLEDYDCYPPTMMDSLGRESLTIEHMLTMTAGFAWDEFSYPYGSVHNSYTQMVATDDWIQFTLDQPMTSKPGNTFAYNTGLSGFMAIVLEKSTGQSVESYAREKLFDPIGIGTCTWRYDPKGNPVTGNGIRMKPRDMAKFGWLYSQNGVWDGDTIVPNWWVEESLKPYTEFGDGRAYGYQWWMATVTDGQENSFYMPYAMGWGGQHIFVPPVLNLVIVVTGDDDIYINSNYIAGILDLIGQAMQE